MNEQKSIIEKLGISPITDVRKVGIHEYRLIRYTESDNQYYTLGEIYRPENANLYASAPEMLEALIEIRGHLPQLSSLPTRTKTTIGEATKKVVNSIEKATGKSWEEIKELIK